jgi:hypothetical protein
VIELTTQQLQALAHSPTPLRLVDPQTKQEYVLVSAEIYQRLQGMLDGALESQEVAELITRTMLEYDANDPLLDSYQKYRK